MTRFLVLFIAGALWGTLVHGQQSTPTITTLTELGRAPYTGDAPQACQILQGYGLEYLTCLNALAVCAGGNTEEVFLEDGMVIVTLQTKRDGTHAATSAVYRPVYPSGHDLAGQPLAINDPDRRARLCQRGEMTIVIPDACGNPSIIQGEAPRPEPQIIYRDRELEPRSTRYEYVNVCEDVPFASAARPTVSNTPGILVSSCDKHLYVPGYAQTWESQGTATGFSRECRTVRRRVEQ